MQLGASAAVITWIKWAVLVRSHRNCYWVMLMTVFFMQAQEQPLKFELPSMCKQSSKSLSEDFEKIPDGSNKSRLEYVLYPLNSIQQMYMSNHWFHNHDSFGLVGLLFHDDRRYIKQFCNQKARLPLSSSKIIFVYKSINPLYLSIWSSSLGILLSHMRWAPSKTLNILHLFQRRTIWVNNNLALSAKISTLPSDVELEMCVSTTNIFSYISYQSTAHLQKPRGSLRGVYLENYVQKTLKVYSIF